MKTQVLLNRPFDEVLAAADALDNVTLLFVGDYTLNDDEIASLEAKKLHVITAKTGGHPALFYCICTPDRQPIARKTVDRIIQQFFL